MNQKTKVSKSLLWFSIISMSMVFAGLTSAYIVRRSSGEWIFFDLPNQFFLSAILLLITSLFLNKSYYSLKKDKLSLSYLLCFFSFFTAVFFCYSQFSAWKQMYLDEIYFSGQKSHPAGSYVYVMSVLHLLHVFAGIILLLSMIGAIVLTYRKREGVKRQSYFTQISRERKDSVKLIDVNFKEGVKIDD